MTHPAAVSMILALAAMVAATSGRAGRPDRAEAVAGALLCAGLLLLGFGLPLFR